MVAEPCQEVPPPGLLVGIGQFNRREFFECHETLEELWMEEARPRRQLYQGILQIGIAFHHLRASRFRPVLTLLQKGSCHLEPFAPTCMGVDVARLLVEAERCLAEVRRLGPEGLNRFDWSLLPRIKITA